MNFVKSTSSKPFFSAILIGNKVTENPCISKLVMILPTIARLTMIPFCFNYTSTSRAIMFISKSVVDPKLFSKTRKSGFVYEEVDFSGNSKNSSISVTIWDDDFNYSLLRPFSPWIPNPISMYPSGMENVAWFPGKEQLDKLTPSVWRLFTTASPSYFNC